MLFKNTIEPNTLELLKKLQQTDELKNFYLAGGTSLALQIGHRLSIDLDLFSLTVFDTNNLLEFLEQNYNFRSDYIAKNTLKGSIKDVKIDFITHKYPLVNPIVEIEGVKLYTEEDIAAMKLNAISGNGTRSKDFVDLYFLLKKYSVEQLLQFYKTKYQTRNILHVIKSMVYFDDISLQDWPELILEKNLNSQKIKKNIEKMLKAYKIS